MFAKKITKDKFVRIKYIYKLNTYKFMIKWDPPKDYYQGEGSWIRGEGRRWNVWLFYCDGWVFIFHSNSIFLDSCIFIFLSIFNVIFIKKSAIWWCFYDSFLIFIRMKNPKILRNQSIAWSKTSFCFFGKHHNTT